MKNKIDRWNEKWEEVPGYNWIYEINRLWQVRSYWKNWNRENRIETEPQRLIQPRRKRLKKYGDRAEVTLFDGLKRKHYYLARIMAKVFLWLDLKDKTKQVTNIDGNFMNCKLENLKIVSVSERQKIYYSKFPYPKKWEKQGDTVAKN